MIRCYLCDEPLTEQNQSLEHIIPNSIGGRLKSKSLICEPCNKNTGSLFDAEFAKLGNVFASKYNILRETGVVQPIQGEDLSTGEKVLVRPGNKINYLAPKSEVVDGQISVTHYDKKRVIQEIRKLSKQRGDEEINEKDLLFESVEEYTQKQFSIDLSIEPTLLLRSVCKTIVNLFLLKTSDYTNCKQLINFLRKSIDNNFCWFLDLGIGKQMHNESPYHILAVRGGKKSKMLYAYFEIFGEIGFLTLINGQYKGEDQQINYTFDPIKGIEIEADYELNLKASDIIQHLLTKPESEMVRCLHH